MAKLAEAEKFGKAYSEMSKVGLDVALGLE